jgi:hypothetical protein
MLVIRHISFHIDVRVCRSAVNVAAFHRILPFVNFDMHPHLARLDSTAHAFLSELLTLAECGRNLNFWSH